MDLYFVDVRIRCLASGSERTPEYLLTSSGLLLTLDEYNLLRESAEHQSTSLVTRDRKFTVTNCTKFVRITIANPGRPEQDLVIFTTERDSLPTYSTIANSNYDCNRQEVVNEIYNGWYELEDKLPILRRQSLNIGFGVDRVCRCSQTHHQ